MKKHSTAREKWREDKQNGVVRGKFESAGDSLLVSISQDGMIA